MSHWLKRDAFPAVFNIPRQLTLTHCVSPAHRHRHIQQAARVWRLEPGVDQIATNMSSLWNRGGPQGQHQITSSQVYPQLPSSNNQFQQQHYQQQSQAMQPYNGNQSVAGPSYGNQQGGPQPQGTVGSYNSSSVGYQPGVVWTQVPIQPLEARAADEDPLYGSLARAKGKVDRAMKSDEDISPDLTTKGQGQSAYLRHSSVGLELVLMQRR